MAGRRSLVRKDLRWHAEESTTARLSRGITDQLGKSLETRPFAVQRPATLQDRHRNPVRSQAYRREATRNCPTYTRFWIESDPFLNVRDWHEAADPGRPQSGRYQTIRGKPDLAQGCPIR